jgi:uroporphyrinogen decarboxylase
MFSQPVQPDYRGLIDCILRKGTPARVYSLELFLDKEVQEAVAHRFQLLDGLKPDDPYFNEQKQIRIQRFLGYDTVRQGLEGMEMPVHRVSAQDTAQLARGGGRSFVESTRGPITNWDEFEKYPWPDVSKAGTRALDWYESNLPEDMCVVGSGGFAHFAEYITWLMGYETLCYALFENRPLVQAIADRILAFNIALLERMLQYKRVQIIWGSDDMGFRSGTLISPKDLRAFVLPGHKKMAEMAHAAGRPYILHSCGNLRAIMPDLIEDVKIDAKHSFEDTIETIQDAKTRYGSRIGVIGGIDVDFLCRAQPEEVCARTRRTLEDCFPGGGYCLGTGNSVANYIPLDNYLAMLDEGRKFTR